MLMSSSSSRAADSLPNPCNPFRADSGVFWAPCLVFKENGHWSFIVSFLFIYVFVQTARSFTLYSLSFDQILNHRLSAHKYLSKGMGLNWLTQTGTSAGVGADVGLIPYSERSEVGRDLVGILFFGSKVFAQWQDWALLGCTVAELNWYGAEVLRSASAGDLQMEDLGSGGWLYDFKTLSRIMLFQMKVSRSCRPAPWALRPWPAVEQTHLLCKALTDAWKWERGRNTPVLPGCKWSTRMCPHSLRWFSHLGESRLPPEPLSPDRPVADRASGEAPGFISRLSSLLLSPNELPVGFVWLRRFIGFVVSLLHFHIKGWRGAVFPLSTALVRGALIAQLPEVIAGSCAVCGDGTSCFLPGQIKKKDPIGSGSVNSD